MHHPPFTTGIVFLDRPRSPAPPRWTALIARPPPGAADRLRSHPPRDAPELGRHDRRRSRPVDRLPDEPRPSPGRRLRPTDDPAAITLYLWQDGLGPVAYVSLIGMPGLRRRSGPLSAGRRRYVRTRQSNARDKRTMRPRLRRSTTCASRATPAIRPHRTSAPSVDGAHLPRLAGGARSGRAAVALRPHSVLRRDVLVLRLLHENRQPLRADPLLSRRPCTGDRAGRRRPARRGFSVRHLHWGGGSPTMLTPDDWLALTGAHPPTLRRSPPTPKSPSNSIRAMRREAYVAALAAGRRQPRLDRRAGLRSPRCSRRSTAIQPFEVVERVVGWLRRPRHRPTSTSI